MKIIIIFYKYLLLLLNIQNSILNDILYKVGVSVLYNYITFNIEFWIFNNIHSVLLNKEMKS